MKADYFWKIRGDGGWGVGFFWDEPLERVQYANDVKKDSFP